MVTALDEGFAESTPAGISGLQIIAAIDPNDTDGDGLTDSWEDDLQFEAYFTEDLSLPLPGWSVLQVDDDDDDGSPVHEWTDPNSAAEPQRFYRVGLLP